MDRPPTCNGCPLDPVAEGFMQAEGSGVSGLMVVAEALGQEEAKDSLPLRPHAPAGGVFDRTVKRAKMDRPQLAITNICKCRPPRNLLENQPYELEAVQHCKQYMDAEIERFQPKVILAMGNIPLKYLAGWTGKKRTVTNVRGYFLNGTRYPGIPVVPTYHPSYIGRDKPNLLGVYRLDLLRAGELAKQGGRFDRPQKNYTLFPNRERVEAFVREVEENPQLPVSYDIETTESLTGVDESEIKGLIDGTVQITKVKEEYQDVPEHLLEDKVEDEEETIREIQIVRNTRITQIQFSLRPGEAIVFPWVEPYISLAMKVLALPNTKLGFNCWSFDDPILRAAGAKIGGVIHDLMWAWHHYSPDLPRGLQYVTSFYIPEAEPWKHLSQADPGNYGGDDVNYPRSWAPKLFKAMEDRGVLKGYERHVVGLNPILVGASRRGMPVNESRRVELGVKVDAAREELDKELQGTYPDELKPVEPRNGYVNATVAQKTREKVGDANGRWVEREFAVSTKAPRKGGAKVKGTSGGPSQDSLPQLDGGGSTGEGGEVPGVVPNPRIASGEGAGVGAGASGPATEKRWCRLQRFLPNSGPHILAYIKWRRGNELREKIAGYKQLTRYQGMSEADLLAMAERNATWQIPKNFKTDQPTTAKKELLRLAAKTGDGFFKKVIQHREFGKLKSTYVDGWAPRGVVNGYGTVHTLFTYVPATGQLSSRGPNIQNAPKHGELAKSFRAMVQAPPGFKLIEVDYTAFHALTLGFEARCPAYMRLAKLDIHSFVAANIIWLHNKRRFDELRLPHNPERWTEMPDEELEAFLAIVKDNETFMRNKKAKPAILGIGFGLGARKLYDMNQESFANKGEAKKIQDIVKGLFPEVFTYQDETRKQAHTQGFLSTLHGYIRWFFDVFQPKKQKNGLWTMEPGKDSEACIAFRPANNAFGMIKEKMLKLDGFGGWGDRLWREREDGVVELLRHRESLMEKYGFINQIHDALLFCCPDRYVEECVHTVKAVMEEPSEVLIDPQVAAGGLVCGAVPEIGEDWAHMRNGKKWLAENEGRLVA